ncbi:MAG: hypothetical protein JO061_14300 [Acidobacteriaceae bacterium]|nr:hypothetical protein [Acidobacteriaceae bacterium]
MSAVGTAGEPLDSSSLQAMLIRWKLAEQYILDPPEAGDAGKMALHVLLSHDVPVLIRELMRLCPELATGQTQPRRA